MRKHSPLHSNKCEYCPSFSFHFKVKGLEIGCTSGKIDIGDLIKANVQRWLIYENEASLQWVQEPGGSFI